jgi:hypothetical protein
MNTGGWHIRMDTSCSTSHARCVTEYKEYQCSKGNSAKRLSIIKMKHNTKTIIDQKETEHKDYQWSKGNRTKRLSMTILMCHPPVFIPVFRRVHVFQALVSSVVLCRSLTVFLFCFLLIIGEWEWNCEYDKRKLWFRYSIKVDHSMILIAKQWERWLHFVFNYAPVVEQLLC